MTEPHHEATPSPLARHRELFEVPRGITYLNTANIGPRLRTVSDAGRQAIDRFARPWEICPEDWFEGPERLREAFARFAGVDADTVALIPSVSYGIALAARNIPLPAGSHVVVVEEQYPSNLYAWRRRVGEQGAEICVAARSAERTLTESVLRLIDARTAVVAVPNCHWTDGELLDLVALGDAARTVGAALVVDASQSLGALPLDFAAVRPDFVVTVGYKWLLGPYGLGYLYAAERWHQEGVPLEESWLTRRGSEDFSRLVDYVDAYRDGARRFDFGEFPQFLSVPMARAALAQLESWGPATVAAELAKRTGRLRTFAERIGLEMLSPERSAGHLLGLRFPDREQLTGIGAALRAADVHVSLRGDKIRVAPHLHNDERDLDRFCEVVESALS